MVYGLTWPGLLRFGTVPVAYRALVLEFRFVIVVIVIVFRFATLPHCNLIKIDAASSSSSMMLRKFFLLGLE